MRAISCAVSAGKVCAWRGNNAAAPVLLSTLIPVAGSTSPALKTCSAMSVFPVLPGGGRVILAGRIRRHAAAPRLGFPPFQIFAQRQLQPVLARNMFALAFIPLIVHCRSHHH